LLQNLPAPNCESGPNGKYLQKGPLGVRPKVLLELLDEVDLISPRRAKIDPQETPGFL
jgi:hypothetical protein